MVYHLVNYLIHEKHTAKFNTPSLKRNECNLHRSQANIKLKTEKLSKKCTAEETSLGSTRATGIAGTTSHVWVNLAPGSAHVSHSCPISIGCVSWPGLRAAHEDKWLEQQVAGQWLKLHCRREKGRVTMYLSPCLTHTYPKIPVSVDSTKSTAHSVGAAKSVNTDVTFIASG
jgi:hypothetical protein